MRELLGGTEGKGVFLTRGHWFAFPPGKSLIFYLSGLPNIWLLVPSLKPTMKLPKICIAFNDRVVVLSWNKEEAFCARDLTCLFLLFCRYVAVVTVLTTCSFWAHRQSIRKGLGERPAVGIWGPDDFLNTFSQALSDFNKMKMKYK